MSVKEGKILMDKKRTILMQKYEVGRLLGQGTFAKVYHARNMKTGESAAVKVIDKQKIMKNGLTDQIKREISVMRLVRHHNVVQLYEVMASKTKIYFAMEFVRGGELFNKVAKGRLKEDAARKFFQQLIAAIDFCHSRGVYHRDLKPENLLLDESGNLKVSDFGLSALLESKRQDGLLHTTCGTPAYVAPEVINKRGYDGEKADIWSCGVILFVLLAGYLPFHETNLMEMYKKISRGDFKCPQWFSPQVKKLLSRILDPNPYTRTTVAKIMENPWFKKGFKHIEIPFIDFEEDDCKQDIVHIHDVMESDSELNPQRPKQPESRVTDTSTPMKPTCMNAFDIISLSKGFNLSGLFENDKNHETDMRFTTQKPPHMVISKLEELAHHESFKVRKKDGNVKLQCIKGGGRKGQLVIDAEFFEVAPSCHIVDVKKRTGDTLEYKKFCDQELMPSLKDILRNSKEGEPEACSKDISSTYQVQVLQPN